MEYLNSIFVFAFGLAIGSFLNVCIVRMPREESIVKPGSHCVSCKKPVLWYDNIPVLSYIVLRGRCRSCGSKISCQYMIVELLTAALFLYVYQHFGIVRVLIPYLIMTSGLIVATFIDIEHRIIPDEISVGGMGVGIVLSALLPEMHTTHSALVSVGRSLLGVLVGGGSIYLMGVIGDFIFKKESMGGGDVKLLAMVGAFLGWQAALLTFFIAPFFGAIVGIIVKIRTKDSLIPYGPFLALGALISLFWGELIIEWIISGYGFSL